MRPYQFGLLIALAALWAAAFLLLKPISEVIGPFALVASRMALASVALLVYSWWLRHLPNWRLHWKAYLILGMLNMVIPFCLLAYSILSITGSLATILNATAPLFTALIAMVWLKRPLYPSQWMGLLLGLVGVSVLVGWSPFAIGPKQALGIGAGLLAAFGFGLGTVYAQIVSHRDSALNLVTGQMVMGALVMALPGAAFLYPNPITPEVIWLTLILSVISTAIGNVVFFYLVEKVGSTEAGSVGFLIPLFGILGGSLFLHEPINWSTWVGMILILVSVALVNRLQLSVRRAAA